MNIKLKDLVNYLEAADLGGLEVKKDLVKICPLINLTLQDLHSRMIINQEEVVIPLVKGKTLYCVDDYIEE